MRVSLKHTHTPSFRSSHSLRTPYTRQNAAFLHSVCIHTHREPALIHIGPPLHICGFPSSIHTHLHSGVRTRCELRTRARMLLFCILCASILTGNPHLYTSALHCIYAGFPQAYTHTFIQESALAANSVHAPECCFLHSAYVHTHRELHAYTHRPSTAQMRVSLKHTHLHSGVRTRCELRTRARMLLFCILCASILTGNPHLYTSALHCIYAGFL